MRRSFRDRAFLPVFIPVAVLLAIGVLVGGFALILLYNTRPVAIVVAIMAAAGILVGVAMANSRDRLGTGQRVVVVIAAAVPTLLGAAYALGVGGVGASRLNINRQPEQDPAVAAGQRLASDYGCVQCHSVDGTTIVGPTWKDLWGSQVTLNSGETVTVDRQYIEQSVKEPDAFARQGFNTGVMPNLNVSDQDLDKIIAYIESLSSNTAEGGGASSGDTSG